MLFRKTAQSMRRVSQRNFFVLHCGFLGFQITNDKKQLSSNEGLSKKDFIHRLKICRKESKESAYWARLILETNSKPFPDEIISIYNEAIELKKIFSSITDKTKI